MKRLLLVMGVLLSGCAMDPAGETGNDAHREPREEPLAPTLIVDAQVFLLGIEWDVMCRSGGGSMLERTGAVILPGFAHLEFTTSASATHTSVQAGYSVDDGAVTWLEPVFAGSATHIVPIPPAAFEAGADRWSFYYQLNVPAAPQDCYTGAGAGSRSITVEAVPG